MTSRSVHDGGVPGRRVRVQPDVHADGHSHGEVQHHQAAEISEPQVRTDHDQNCAGVGHVVSLSFVFFFVFFFCR